MVRLSQIEVLRLLYVAFIAALIVILVMTWLIYSDEETPGSMTTEVPILVAAAAAVLVIMGLARRRSITPDSEQAAVGQYTTQTFMNLALAESVPILGFVLSFVNGSITPYVIALAASIPAFVLAAPTERSVAGFQESITNGIDGRSALYEAR